MRERLEYTNSFLIKNSIIFTAQKRKILFVEMIKDCYVVVSLLRKIELQKYICTRDRVDITIAVMMAKRSHLFPFRTQKLSSFTPKVLAENCREDR